MSNFYITDKWTRSQLLEERAGALEVLEQVDAALALLPEDDDYEDEQPWCHACNGTGEGQHDGSRCYSCRGSGVERRERDYDD